jgi:hypothetical protein
MVWGYHRRHAFGAMGPLSVMPNKPLVPTRNGEAPLLAAQRWRWAVETAK